MYVHMVLKSNKNEVNKKHYGGKKHHEVSDITEDALYTV